MKWHLPCDAVCRETIEKLRNFWYGTKVPLGGVATEPAPKPGDGNGVCTHLACAKRPFCIVAKLEEVKKLYVPGRDQFRIKVGGPPCHPSFIPLHGQADRLCSQHWPGARSEETLT